MPTFDAFIDGLDNPIAGLTSAPDIPRSFGASKTPNEVGGGGGVVYRMRGDDGTLGYPVYWNSSTIDTLGADYAGPGPLTEVVVSKILGS